MLPPSDSLRHQSHKRSEAAANTHREDRRPPPPPYSPSIHTSPRIESICSRTSPIEDYDEADDTEADLSPPRITIHIDASISIIGDANTVIIPPSSAPSPAELPGPDTGSNSSTATAALQAIQKQRQSRLTDMATAIIDALGRSGLLAAERAGCAAPVEVKITPGIRVEGSRNAVCVGALPRGLGRGSCPGAAVERDMGRKRRACSEPVERPSPKRGC